MNKNFTIATGRLDRYLFRVKRSLREGKLIQALADTAELGEIARRLYIQLEGVIRTHPNPRGTDGADSN